jgi:predicted RNase H-like HicB family nuclease
VGVGGKGSHRNFVHPKPPPADHNSGALGDDARPYQLKGVAAAIKESRIMKESDKYAKVVEWSEEDGCYVGTAPGSSMVAATGPDKQAVYEELCQIVEETIELYKQDNEPLPPPTVGRFSDLRG